VPFARKYSRIPSCNDFICKEHLSEKNKIKCGECKREFNVNDDNNNNEFKTNKLIQKQLDNQLYLSATEVNLKQKIEDSIRLLHRMHDEFTLTRSKLDADVHAHFQEIRFQIDEHREQLKDKIDQIALGMIDETKKLEALYLKNLQLDTKTPQTMLMDDRLKEIDETFRNPDLLIESIQEIQLKQDEAIDEMTLKFNEINQIKDHLKASNEFTPQSVEFDRDSFGSLCLNEYSIDPFKSKILTGKQPSELMKLCEFSPNDDKWRLLYRGTRDGFSHSDFHSKCDDRPNTLTIFKAKESKFIFGGFTTVAWQSTMPHQYKTDPNAFLFSLTNRDNRPYLLKIKPKQSPYAICCYSLFGPIFGNGHDIFIASNSNESMDSYANLGFTYVNPKYSSEQNGAGNGAAEDATSFLAGSLKFQLVEIEVYQRE
jgi:hypothetical protein